MKLSFAEGWWQLFLALALEGYGVFAAFSNFPIDFCSLSVINVCLLTEVVVSQVSESQSFAFFTLYPSDFSL